ncbi:hypothetical protein [Pseudomonas sp. LFM046]|uniref:hypothetical protein n=1 Tax=Pseudomonas sp. LFM046 TaxID=1608357 RepID=UPI0005CFDB61|nr:hypothetical protein [Pseudomonas sp. LFM046]
MDNPFSWAEPRRLSLNASACHIAMVDFLEQAMVPWTAAQVLEFERLSAAKAAALDEYRSFFERIRGGYPTPRQAFHRSSRRQA